MPTMESILPSNIGDNKTYSELLNCCYNGVLLSRDQQGSISFDEERVYISFYIGIGLLCIILNFFVIASGKDEKPWREYQERVQISTRQMFILLRCSLAAADMLSGIALVAAGILSLSTIKQEQNVLNNGKKLCQENLDKYIKGSKICFIDAAYNQNKEDRNKLSELIDEI